MAYWPVFRTIVVLAVFLIASNARPHCPLGAQNFASGQLSAENVRSAIDRGVRYLLNDQQRTGRWSTYPDHPGGVTAICTLALLNSGVSPHHPKIERALGVLDRTEINSSSVYTVSLMTMVYCLADPDNYRSRIRSCVEYLDQSQVKSGRGQIGGWSYRVQPRNADTSNSQFALLALHEAALVGVEADQEVWQKAAWYWQSVWHQVTEDSGGFRYHFTIENAPTGSMTCAGIASLIIIDEHLEEEALPLDGNKILCCGDDDRIPGVEMASKWLANNFRLDRNPGNTSTFRRNVLYFMYGMERAARLSGQRFFGEHDWYREGAEKLLNTQKIAGNWIGNATHGESNPHICTAFALLFLSKGRRPVVIGKYQHSLDNDWDRHRTGVHHLTRALEADWDKQFNWQTIDGRHASTNDLLEVPLLFLSGRDGLKLDEEQKQRLREYVEYGGFIFAEACQGDDCGQDVGFDKDFRALMEELFPQSQLLPLDANHPIYSAQYNLIGHPDRPLYGLQTSCRTSIVYCPANLSGLWRLRKPSFWNRLPEEPKKEVDYATRLGVNVVTYATGRELKDKLDRPTISSAVEGGLGSRVVVIPKLAHGGGDDDAPNAWRNIMTRARFDLAQRFRIERVMVAPDRRELANYPMVFMHGRNAFSWSDEERDEIAAYFANGGFLFADAVCSSAPFVNSFRGEMKQIFPNATLARIQVNHPLWNRTTAPYQITTVNMHEPGDTPGTIKRIETPPLLEGIEVDGRLVVVFSPHDLSCAMENASATQCPGYDQDDAARIGVNVIRYAFDPD